MQISNIALNTNMMHTWSMRTSVTLDEDVYQLAMLYSKGRGLTLGAAIGELVRRGEKAPHVETALCELKRASNGLLIFPSKGRKISSEMVKEALEEDD
jgi:macrodomain Ter protein organizer (MatP/YcbG family)